MIAAVTKETFPGERRVALIPDHLPLLKKKGWDIHVQAGAGTEAGLPDSAYADKGAKIIEDRAALLSAADLVAQVRSAGANLEAGAADLQHFRSGQIIIGFSEPLGEPQAATELAVTGAQLLAMELIPRTTRAQSMDALSSMATVAGYKAVLLAAAELPKMFPMMMTAAGTIAPARVFVVGAGVAGLQAIASARRLGAVVQAYDVRPAVKEQVESLGARFVEMQLETGTSEDKGGYAKAMDEAFYERQRELMLEVVSESDVVITTAAIPGKKAPILVTAEMIKAMPPRSVVVDLAAERGGNCELTRSGSTVIEHEVTIMGPDNLTSTVPLHASQMYGKNVANFMLHMTKDAALHVDRQDDIIHETMVTADGQVVHNRIRELLGLEALPEPGAEAVSDAEVAPPASS